MKFKDLIFASALIIFLLTAGPGSAAAFELKYLHPTGADIDYTLEIVKKDQKTALDINRHITDNNGTNIKITTSFTNTRIEKGGIITPLTEVDGQVSLTTMDSHGVVSAITPLSSFGASATSLNLTLQRDIMNNLGVSSFPTGDLSVGDSWTKPATKGNSNAVFTYTIVQAGLTEAGYTSVVQVDISSSFDINEANDIAQARTTSYMKGKIALNGSFFFDITTGKIVKIIQNINYKMLNILVDFNGIPSIVPDDGVMTSTLLIK